MHIRRIKQNGYLSEFVQVCFHEAQWFSFLKSQMSCSFSFVKKSMCYFTSSNKITHSSLGFFDFDSTFILNLKQRLLRKVEIFFVVVVVVVVVVLSFSKKEKNVFLCLGISNGYVWQKPFWRLPFLHWTIWNWTS